MVLLHVSTLKLSQHLSPGVNSYYSRLAKYNTTNVGPVIDRFPGALPLVWATDVECMYVWNCVLSM